MKNLIATLVAVLYFISAAPHVLAEEQNPAIDHGHMRHQQMAGLLGSYPMTRDATGSGWQPDATAHEGLHQMMGEWSTMLHGTINAVYTHQGGLRGDDQSFAAGMMMMMARKPLGNGTLGLRAMISPDPLMGKSGYPLLFQTGETADGVEHLVDRQHPHDFFVELAASYSLRLTDHSSVFAYVGLPGEPALGPPTFMHRFSGMDNPEA